MGRRTELIHKTDLDLAYGLSEEEVKQRQKEGLTNKITKNVTKSYGRIIFDNVFNFFNIILFAISIFMIIIKAQPRNFIFLYLLIINIAIGIAQDIKARKQTDKLKVISFPIVHVLRDGNIITIPANEIVLCDIVLISTGDQIVADGTVLQGEIEVNESLLTGESVNILKKPGDPVLSGSYLTSGNAKMRVDRVGKANYAETLQTKARAFKRPKSEILKTINLLFKIIGVTAIALGIFTVVSYILQGKFAWPGFNDMVGSSFQESGLALSAMMTSMMPVGMYLFVSITLAVGVIRLAKHRVLVQELYCIEMLARADVLCLDKTGTITDGSMRVRKLEFFSKKESEYDIENVLATLVSATGDVNATAKAIKRKYSTHEHLPHSSALPFNSARKFSAVMLKDGRCFVLGAREFLPHKESEKIDGVCEEYEKQGLRVLMLGSVKHAFKHDEEIPEVTPVCAVVLEDKIKSDAIENIEWFKSNGVAIKIISGDNPISVSEIAKRVGVEDADKFISLEGMSLSEVKKIANQYTVFGRVSPEQKEVIVEALQKKGHTVAMTGDGVNDILALKAADCSIAMASGSDAAKAASHLVSLDNNFSSLPQVVSEGRRVINNLQRTCSVFLIKSFFIITFSSIFLFANWFTKGSVIYPFAVNMTNIWELITVGLACFFLSLQPNSERTHSTFMKNIITMVGPGVLIQDVSVGVIFLISAVSPTTLPLNAAITMAVLTFTAISFITIITISIPFDVYRAVLSIGLGIMVVLFFVIDAYWFAPNNISEKNPTGSFFSLDYDAFRGGPWWILLIVLAIAIPAYFGAIILARYINKRLSEKGVIK